MSDQNYYVKIRGRVVGPFPPSRLTQMVQRGQLSRVHLLSIDGHNWERASEFPQFFEVAPTPDPTPATNAPASGSESSGRKIALEESTQSDDYDLSINKIQWHYAINDQSTGPISHDAIVRLITNGELSFDDMVWHSGLQEWTPVDRVPELAKLLQSPKYQTDKNPGSAKGKIRSKKLSDSSSDDFGSLKPIVRSSTPWVYFICCFLFLVSIALFFQFLTGLIIGGREQNGLLVFMGITAFIQMAITVTAGIFLQRHASAANRFVLTERPSSLYESLQWLNRFWLLISIVIITWMVFALVAVILVYSMGVQLQGMQFN